MSAWPSIDAVLVGDAAMGTALRAAGLPAGAAPELWNLARPDAVRAVHAAHRNAGAGWLTANTLGANRPALVRRGVEADPADLTRMAVALARSEARGLPVLLSMGPTGSGDPRDWEAAYREQAEAAAREGVDGALVETAVRLDEALAAVRAARRAGVGFLIASHTPGPRGLWLDGTPLVEAAEALVSAGADALGVNCGSGPGSMARPVRLLVRAGLGPVYVAANAGLPTPGAAGPPRWPVGPRAFARWGVRFAEAGATLLAGCCGTSAEHLRALRAAL